jgi:Lon-like ATP-dependent protease
VSSIDEGLELLTGVPAGERGTDGAYPDTEVSVHGAVQKRLRQLAVELEAFGKDESHSPTSKTDA